MKTPIREQYKETRRSISEIEREMKSHRIFSKLMELPEFQTAQKILVHLSKGEEVVTHFMVQRWLQTEKTLFVPKVKDDHFIACRLDHWEDLEFGAYGVLEPSEVIEIGHPSEIDLILVPGLAFTPSGVRLGMGKGYYDRFLKHTKATKIGLAYEEQIVNELPKESHDVDMDIIITDQTIYRP